MSDDKFRLISVGENFSTPLAEFQEKTNIPVNERQKL